MVEVKGRACWQGICVEGRGLGRLNQELANLACLTERETAKDRVERAGRGKAKYQISKFGPVF